MKKISYILILILLTFSLAGCNNQNSSSSQGNNQKSSSKQQKSSNPVSAQTAWEKVKPQAEKWSNSYKIAKIQDVSTSNFNNIDGKSNGWKFYLEECTGGEAFGKCAEGKTKSFYYYTEKVVGEKKGVSSKTETSIPAGLSTFNKDKFKIDSTKALEIVLNKLGKQKKEGERFDFKTRVIGDKPIWQVGRQCQPKASINDRCNNKENYVGYVNLENGAFYRKKPQT